MLPEHQELLNEMWRQEEWKEKPILDEQYITEINSTLQLALEHDIPITIEYFKQHDYHYVTGKLLSVDPLLNYVRIKDKEIPLDRITGAKME